MSILKCEHLSLGYEDRVILNDLSFEVNSGDYLCILGENGAGKSTLIKGLLGLMQPRTGKIVFGDGLKKNEIGYLPQQTEVQKDFPASVYEVVLSGCLNSLGKHLFYGEEQKKRALHNLERMGIEQLKDCSYQRLSGGQQQRVLLARALCATGKLLLLDEPVTGLDPVATVEMYNLIKLVNLCDSVSVIMVSHDIHEAVRYSTHILHLGQNRTFFGTTSEYRESDLARRFLKEGRS